jgi:phosphoglycerol transferase MdoB-like AlkP superfamily enzyme
MDWFENTLFVITADHSSALSNNKNYKNKLGRYSVPMLFWKSDKSLKGQLSNSSQHIDIFPTTMELLGYDKEFFSFGKSILQEQDGAITFLKNEYLMITKDAYLTNRDEVYTLYKDKNLKEKVPQQHELVNKMKAIKQGFNNALITNQMRVNEN